jgi:predicted amidohydrolase
MFIRQKRKAKIHQHAHIVFLIICCWLMIGANKPAHSNDNPPSRNTVKSATKEFAKLPSTDNTQAYTSGKKKGFVKIATIGPQPLVVDPKTSPQQVLDKIITFWRGHFSRVLPDRPDLIVVPEACDRPRGLDQKKLKEYYRVRKNQVRDYFAKVASENSCYIVYSAIREMLDGSWLNSSIMLDRKGEIAGIYNKNHPTIGEMKNGILCGKDAPIIECDFGRVALAICFDLNFDELRLKYVKAKPDLIVFSSMYHGGMMQAYWAFACRSHFVGAIANRATPSQIRNPLGEIIASNTNYFDYTVETVNLDCALVHLDENWDRLRAMNAKYGAKVKITDPGLLGCVLVASEHDKISIEEMIDEFEIERLDDYFARSLDHRHKPGNMEQ